MILVDAPRRYRGRTWAHMVSDRSDDELHRMAARIGLKRRWFQSKRIPHYDLSLSKWKSALHQDVKCVTTKELVIAAKSAGASRLSLPASRSGSGTVADGVAAHAPDCDCLDCYTTAGINASSVWTPPPGRQATGGAASVGTVKYRTIVVDPPWAYNDKLGDGPRGAASHYPCASVAEICAIPVGEWADTPSHLYLWTTASFMEEAHFVAREWGFQKRQILVWKKSYIGLGHYFRNNTEFVLFCVRGSLPPKRRDLPTCFTGRNDGRTHSQKPAAFYDMVESMSPGPYLDVFARKLRFNWDAWGDEVGAPPGLPTPQEIAALEAP